MSSISFKARTVLTLVTVCLSTTACLELEEIGPVDSDLAAGFQEHGMDTAKAGDDSRIEALEQVKTNRSSIHRYPLPELSDVSVASLKGGTLFVKLKDSSSSLQGQDIVTTSGVSLTQKLVDSGQIARVSLAFGDSTQAVVQEQRKGPRVAGMEDLSQWYVVEVTPTGNPVKVARELYKEPSVETAYPAPTIARASIEPKGESARAPAVFQQMTNMDAWQVYDKGSRYWGIDMEHLRQRRAREIQEKVHPDDRLFRAVDGKGVRVVDIEDGWNLDHVDLSALRQPGAFIAWDGGQVVNNPGGMYHGTPVVSIMSADRNGMGMTGLVPEAKLHVSSPLQARPDGSIDDSRFGTRLHEAIYQTAKRLSPGDVMVIEYHIVPNPHTGRDQWAKRGGCAAVTGDTPTPGAIPVQYDQLYNVAIRYAVAKGIHVVQAAGNGAQNLADPCFGKKKGEYATKRNETGSILVGAGTAPVCWTPTSVDPSKNRTKTPGITMPFSNYGSPVDLQAWGECILSLGPSPDGEDLSSNIPNASFNTSFGGTSGASPIVASAVVALSAVAEDNGISVPPAEMLSLLKATATPVNNPGRQIGPLPNLRTAVAELLRIPLEPEPRLPLHEGP